jgi:hypothetical protein
MRENSLEAMELQGSLLAKNLKIRETGINSKIFHYWKMNGLASTIDLGVWAEISFIEYLWLKVLESMRGFGCSLKLMQKIYYEQFIKAYDENLAERTIKDNIAYYKSIARIRPLEKLESQKLEESERVANDPLIGVALRTEISFFFQMVLACIIHRKDLALVIYPDETYEFTYDIDLIRKSNRPHIFISLSYFITQMLEDEKKDEFIGNTGIFNRDEMRIIQELRNMNVDRIVISFHEDGKVKNIDYDEKGLVQGEKVKDVMRILGLRSFDSITLNIRNGTTLSFTKTGKNKIQ